MRQVEGEVDDAAARCRQVGLVEEDAHQEALHDGRQGEGQQEQEEDDGVAVIQNFASLWACGECEESKAGEESQTDKDN